MLPFTQLPGILKGQVVSLFHGSSVEHLLIDSRKLVFPETSLFFAIRGERHDGHRFIGELYQKGVRQFVVEEEYQPNSRWSEANIIRVRDSVEALQTLAAWHRSQFTIPVVAITGSNGKTIVKEWLATLLGKQYRVIKSPKSYNSQVGVPLSVWQMNESHTLAIFEAGISRPDEMSRLEKVIQPTYGIFTNIGTAHDEGFTHQSQKIREKAALFQHCPVVVYGRDDAAIHAQLSRQQFPEQILCNWSRQQEATVQVVRLEKKSAQTDLSIRFQEQTFDLSIPFIDEASLENSLHCITLMLYLGMEAEEVQARLRLLSPVSMRLELKEGINGSYLIDDTYNNDLAGLTIALDFLSGQKQKSTKTLILSDVLESGMDEAVLYKQIAGLLKSKGIDRLVGIGEVISRNKHMFSPSSVFFEKTEDFLVHAAELSFYNELILIKGARTFRFERIVRHLQQKTHGTLLEINLDALLHNLNYYRSKLKPGTKIMVMVKAFAYGSGSIEVANLLQFHRVDYLAVAYTDEGVFLRENGIHLPIMVMNPSVHTFDKLLAYQLEPQLYSKSILQEFLTYLEETDRQARIHLKLDTGMHRLGFEPHELSWLTEVLHQQSRITLASIFSHLAAADENNWDSFSREQISQFISMADQIESVLDYKPIRHILNTAGIARFPDDQMEMVRLGIGLYGVGINAKEAANLETVGTLKTTISQIKHIKASDTVGYGRKGKLNKDTTLATIAIGYADGFDRRLSNGVGKVWVNGGLAPVVGNVCMDMTMIDITGIKAKEGDEVIIFGKENPISELAISMSTIPYEILTGVGERVKRVFFAS